MQSLFQKLSLCCSCLPAGKATSQSNQPSTFLCHNHQVLTMFRNLPLQLLLKFCQVDLHLLCFICLLLRSAQVLFGLQDFGLQCSSLFVNPLRQDPICSRYGLQLPQQKRLQSETGNEVCLLLWEFLFAIEVRQRGTKARQ
eukprot:Skav204391  [mRNA]  locus=scaffold2947:87035:94810:- [translate_table: standard]